MRRNRFLSHLALSSSISDIRTTKFKSGETMNFSAFNCLCYEHKRRKNRYIQSQKAQFAKTKYIQYTYTYIKKITYESRIGHQRPRR